MERVLICSLPKCVKICYNLGEWVLLIETQCIYRDCIRCCCRSDTAVDAQPVVAVSASALPGSGVSQAISEAEVKSEPITPPPQPTTSHEMFGVRNPALLHGHYVADAPSNHRFPTVAGDGRFTSHPVGHRFQSSSSECSTPTGEAVVYRPLLGAHQTAPARHFHPNETVGHTAVDLFQSDVNRFQPGVGRFSLGMEPFRGRLTDSANIVNGAEHRFQFLHPPRYLTNGADHRFHAIPAAHVGDDCLASRFQLAAVGESVVAGGPAAVAPTNAPPLNSVYQCHRDFDGGLYAAAKRPRLTADDWLCWTDGEHTYM